MDVADITRQMREVEQHFGLWTADNIRLADGVYTLGMEPQENEAGKPYTGHEGVDPRIRRFVQVVADLSGQPLRALRVLDLGPLEGGFSVEFALQGAQVLAIEGREANLAKIDFVKNVLGLNNLELVLDDIRHLDPEKHGRFDVVICSGVLYHLQAADQVPFMRRVAEVCRRFALIETHFSPGAEDSFTHGGKTYWGRRGQEHDPDSTLEERLADPWQSLDNVESFALSRHSLYNLARHVGFTTVCECHNPMAYAETDRNLFLAFKGSNVTIQTNPMLNRPEEDWPQEVEPSGLCPNTEGWFEEYERLRADYAMLASRHDELSRRHAPFTYLSGALRELPGLFWDALRRRWPWKIRALAEGSTRFRTPQHVSDSESGLTHPFRGPPHPRGEVDSRLVAE